MAVFKYQALNSQGQLVSGELEAEDVQLAIGELHSRGLSLQSISVEVRPAQQPHTSDSVAVDSMGARPSRITPANVELDVLRSHMTLILERGRTIEPALSAYAEEMSAGWPRRQLKTVCRILQTGDPAEAADALAALPECWIPLLSAATTSPDPGRVLSEFLRESQNSDDLRQKWWLTLVYPLIVTALAIAVMTALSTFVIPEFHQIFEEFDLSLPVLTRFVLELGAFFATWGVPILVALGILLVLLLLKANRYLPTKFLSAWGDWLRLPFGRRTALARFSRFLADLLEAGVSIPNSLRIAGFTVDQTRIRQSAWQLATDLEVAAGPLPSAARRALTSSVTLALGPEIKPESRIRMLREISECHAERVRIGTSWTTGLFEPLAICAVGFVVGCTVLGLFLPLVSLVEGLSK